MIEKLKLEPYIKESLYVRLREVDGKLVAERYDTIYWVREHFFNVTAPSGLEVYTDAKKFCDLATSLKSVEKVSDAVLALVLFNGARYEVDIVNPEVQLPTFTLKDLSFKSVFEFCGVEKAVSKSPLQKELNTVYADDQGIVASSSIVGGVSRDAFKSLIPFAVPEGVHSLFGGEEVEWDIKDNALYAKFGTFELVSVLPKLSDFAWWDVVRASFEGVDFESGSRLSGLRSSLGRLSIFGSRVVISGGRVSVDDTHWEPIGLVGNGEIFDIPDLMQVVSDDEMIATLSGGNLYLRTGDADFVVCSVDVVQA